MNFRSAATGFFAAALIICAAGEAFARNAGQGAGQQLRDGSCITNQTSTKTQTMQQDRLRDGSCLNTSGAASRSASKDINQGQMRRLGPGDGTGNVTRPLDGTGYGSPSAKQ